MCVTRFLRLLYSSLLFVFICPGQVFAAEFSPHGSSVSVSQGALNFNHPIVLPPLPGRLELPLSVAYSDRLEKGLFGSGAELSGISRISRCKPGVLFGDSESSPVTMTSRDRLCLNGMPLRLVSGNYWGLGAEYRTSIETYARITATADGFKVEYKSGLVAHLNHHSKTSNGAVIYEWSATRINDRYGNVINIDYLQPPLRYGSLEFTQAVPAMISYGNVKVNFGYVDGARVARYAGLSQGKTIDLKLISFIDIVVEGYPVRRYEFDYQPAAVPTRVLSRIAECGVESLGQSTMSCVTAAELEWEGYNGGFRNIPVQSFQREFPNESRSWIIDVFTADLKGNGVRDVLSVSANGRLVVYEARLDGSGSLRHRNLLSSNVGAGSGTRWFRNSFSAGDLTNNGRDEIVYAEGDYHTSSNTAIYNWRILSADNEGNFTTRQLNGLSTTSLALNSSANEQRFFMNFLLNMASGIKPVIADVTGDNIKELILPVRLDQYSDRFEWGIYTVVQQSGGYRAMLQGTADGIDSSRFTSALSVNLKGNGRSQLIFISEGGSAPAQGKWQIFDIEYRAIPLLFLDGFIEQGCKPYFFDFQNDGLTDLLLECDRDAKLYVSNGISWVLKFSSIANFGELLRSGIGGVQIADIDGTGLQRFLIPPTHENGTWRTARINQNGEAVVSQLSLPYTLRSTNLGAPSSPYSDFINIIVSATDRRNQAIQVGDMTGDGIPNIFQANAASNLWDIFVSDRSNPYKINEIVDNMGNKTLVSRSTLSDVNVYTSSKPTVNGYREAPYSTSIVTRLMNYDSSGRGRAISYDYVGARRHFPDLGFTGFNEIMRVDETLGSSTRTRYSQENQSDLWRINGRPLRVETFRNGLNLPVNVEVLDWEVDRVTGQSFNVYNGVRSVAVLDGKGGVSSVSRVERNVNSADGVLTYEGTTTGLGVLSNGRPSITQIVSRHEVEHQNISSDFSSWLLGFVGKKVETNIGYASGSTDSKTRTTLFIQYPGSLDASEKIDFWGEPNYQVVNRYSYDGSGNITKIEKLGDEFGGARIWTFGNFINNLYIGRKVLPSGHEEEFSSYDYRFGQPTSVIDANGLATSYRYDMFGRTVSVDSYNRVREETRYALCRSDCNVPHVDSSTLYYKVYSSVKALVSGELGAPSSIEYFDSNSRRVARAVTGFDGAPIYETWHYDAAGRLLKKSAPFSNSAKAVFETYSDFDHLDRPRLVEKRSASGSVFARTTFDYQTYGGGTRLTVQEEYFSDTEQAEAFSRATVTYYDPLGNPTERIEGYGTVDEVSTRFQHDALGNLVNSVINSDMRTQLVRSYDVAGNRILQLDPSSGRTEYKYDRFGNLIEYSDQLGNVTSYIYDRLDRVVSRVEDLGDNVKHTEWFYDQSSTCASSGRFHGAVCHVRDSQGYKEYMHYDQLGRLEISTTIAEIGPTLSEYSFGHVYDDFGREVARTYPNGFAIFLHYNQYGYLSSIEDENGLALKSIEGLNSFGRESVFSFGNGIRTTIESSSIGGLPRSIYRNESLEEYYQWYSNGFIAVKGSSDYRLIFSYDSLSRLDRTLRVANGGGVSIGERFVYDSFGNVIKKPGLVRANYENSHSPFAVTSIDKGYFSDPVPVLTAIYNSASPCLEGGEYRGGKCSYEKGFLISDIHQYVRNEVCPLLKRNLDGFCYETVQFECSKYGLVNVPWNGSWCGVEYQVPLASVGLYVPSCPSDLSQRHESFNMHYGMTIICYDAGNVFVGCPSGSFRPGDSGKICYQEVTKEPVTVDEKCIDQTAVGWFLPHDTRTAAHNSSCWWIERPVEAYCPGEFVQSDEVDLVEDWANPHACVMYDYVIPESGSPVVEMSITYSYDGAGNVINRGGALISYNSFSQPLRIEDGSNSTEFRYGPSSARYAQISPGERRYYSANGLYEVITKGSANWEVAYVGDFLQVVTTPFSQSYQYIHRDHLGSILLITDSYGNEVSAHEYESFGQRLKGSNITNRGFTDHEHLVELGLIHMNGRLYDPLAGRFMSPDPALQAPYLSQNYNRYSYVLNNPVNLIDPTGYFFQEIVSGLGDIAISIGLTEYQLFNYISPRQSNNYFVNEALSIYAAVGNSILFVANSSAAVIEGAAWAPSYGASFLFGNTVEWWDHTFFAASLGAYRYAPLLRFSRNFNVTKGPQTFRNLAPADEIIPAVLFPANQIQKVGYSGRLTYVVKESGELVIGRTPHTSLSQGANVLAAGEARFVNGTLRSIDNASGHYRPSGAAAQNAAETAFGRAGFDTAGKYIERSF